MTTSPSSPTTAVLIHLAPGAETPPTAGAPVQSTGSALSPILGRSPFQRHLRHLSSLGVRRFVVPLAGPAAVDAVDALEAIELTCRKQAAEVVSVPLELIFTASDRETVSIDFESNDLVVLVSAGRVLDPRIYRAAFDVGGPVWIGDRPAGAGPERSQVEVVGLRIATPEATTSTGDLLLPQSLRGADGDVLLVGDLDPYIPNLRRSLRPYWTPTRDSGDRERAASMILDATQKGVLDFPARFLHPPPENFLVRLFSSTRITPNQITVVTGFIGFAATWLFAVGSYAPGLAIALLVNILDGVDGKLARVKLLASRFGDRLDHILDILFEFSWYLGIGWGLSGGDPGGTPFRLGAGLIVIMLGSRAISGVYKLLSGRQIHDHRAFDRAFRLVAGRRNIYVVMLVVGLLGGVLPTAFTLCFAWSGVTFIVYCGRTAMAAVSREGRGEGQPA